MKLYSRFYTAFTLLTRFPLPFGKKVVFDSRTLSGSSAFYPLIGLFYGLISAGLFLFCRMIKLNVEFTAFVILTIPYLLNRFLHFDGLCDVLDAFLSDKNFIERLVILKDSRNGSFALGGSVLFLLLKWIVLKQIYSLNFALTGFILAPVLSRTLITVLAFSSVYPRAAGTGKHLVGQISKPVFISAMISALILISGVILLTGKINLTGFIAASAIGLIWAVLFRVICYKKIGGVTGDCLGALSESSELLFLTALVLIPVF